MSSGPDSARDAEGTEATPDGLSRTGEIRGPASAPRLPGYRIEGVLGRGGMGDVFDAWDLRLHRRVAIKLIRDGRRDDPDARARLWREARALAAIRHPNVVAIYDLGQTRDGTLFVVMERIEGRPLSELVGEQWPVSRVAPLLAEVADALAAIHSAGLLHRDIKPSNVLVDAQGRAHLIDFGVARREAAGGAEAVTETGARVGTPGYMAPEQVAGGALSPATDLFALGVMAYRLLTGAHPFTRSSAEATAMATLTAQFEPLRTRRPDLPAAVDECVQACMQRDPADRPRSATWVADVFRSLEGAPIGPVSPVAPVAPWPHPHAAPESLPTSTRGELDYASDKSGWLGRRSMAPVALALVVISGGIWFATSSGSMPADAPVAPTSTAPPTLAVPIDHAPPAQAPLTLPERPAIAVLAPREPIAVRAAAEALRHTLDLAPDAVQSVPSRTLQELSPPTDVITADDLHRLREGHLPVDAVLRLVGSEPIALELVDLRQNQVVWRHVAPLGELGEQPGAWAHAAATSLLGALGHHHVDLPIWTASVEAWASLSDLAVAESNSEEERAESIIEDVLRTNPRFGPARLADLATMRANRRWDELLRAVRALRVESVFLSPRLADRLDVWEAIAEDRERDAVSLLERQLERWPWDIEVHGLLMVMRQHSASVNDIREVERVARLALDVAPHFDPAASRLVRVLGFQQRLDELRAVRDRLAARAPDVGMQLVVAEADLHLGRFAEAVEGFEKVSRAMKGSMYADHHVMIAHLLQGDCSEALALALARIERLETRGELANLQWTYSVAIQALLCREQWDKAVQLGRRMQSSGHGPHGFLVALPLLARLGRGDERSSVAEDALRVFEQQIDNREAWPELALLLAQVGAEADRLQPWVDRLLDAEADLDVPSVLREDIRLAGRALRARVAQLTARADADEQLRALLPHWGELSHEGGLAIRVRLMAAAAAIWDDRHDPDEADRMWSAIRDLGYARLWATDVWVQAGRRQPGGQAPPAGQAPSGPEPP